MKICLFSNVFFPSIGGIETCSLNLATAWTQMGHDVLLISYTPAESDYDSRFPFRVVRSPTDRLWIELLKDRQVLISNGRSMKHLRVWRRAGVPFGWIHAGAFHDHVRGMRAAASRFMRRMGTRLGSFNICVSESIKQNVGNDAAVVIYNAVSPIFRPLNEIKSSGRFLYYGRIWMAKGVDTLLEAMALLRNEGLDCPVDFIGDGEDMATAHQMAASLRVTDLAYFHPALHGEALVEAINRSLAVIVPSHCQEAFGLAAAEALACGKCVIGALDGGLPEVLGDAALTFSPNDVPALAAHMRATWKDPAIAQKFRQRALDRAKAFSLDAIARQYIELFESVIAR